MSNTDRSIIRKRKCGWKKILKDRLKIVERLELLESGETMVNSGTEVFLLFGRQYTTGKKKQVEYRMDNSNWRVGKRYSFLKKIAIALFGGYRLLKKR